MNIKRRAFGSLLLVLIASGCQQVNPPNPPNYERVDIQAAVATACKTVTWSMKFLKNGADVTGAAWYRLNTDSAPVQAPHFTLTPSSQATTTYFVEATDQAGNPLTAGSFSTSIENSFTCTQTAQTVTLVNAQVPGAGGTNLNYPNITLSYINGSLSATR